jgi:hypothetical protein
MIIDCFTFFNELDLLEIRLNTLKDEVDRFVLVESTRTHQGKSKPLYFSENRSRFKDFENRITVIVVDDFPENPDNSAWVFEHHQRNCILRGLRNCQPDDLILISDVDEIPNPATISSLLGDSTMMIFRQKMYYYYLNCINSTASNKYSWNGTIKIRYKDIGIPQELREISMRLMGLQNNKLIHRLYWKAWAYFNLTLKNIRIDSIDMGGWHFSYLGGTEAIIKKIEAFAHTEYNNNHYKNAENIENAINHGQDIFGRDFQYNFVPIDNTYPDYIKDNSSKFAHLIKCTDHVVYK